MNHSFEPEQVREMFETAIATGEVIYAASPIPEGKPFAQEWQTFKRELPRLLAEGHRGRTAVIKGDQVISVWDTMRDAKQAAQERFGQESVFLEPIHLFIRHLTEDPAAQPDVRMRQPTDSRTIHYTQLGPDQPDSELYTEWETYRSEVGRLLQEGNEGRHILIKGDQIIGIWDTRTEALTAGSQRFFGQAFFVHQIQTYERLHITPWSWICRT